VFVLDALGRLDGGHGVYNAIKVWEIGMMMKLGIDEFSYTQTYTTRQRAMMIAADKLPDFMKILEDDRAFRESKAKNG